ncbi:NAD(P)-dependent alcohol dehydrogenase [Hymenobacter sp. ASUV-10]|uniref:NAD(P)-dependent alcohol dehydrogenase n=1 Tax=Hymenobacter aranciens TaxID=3063996 RepID=A0ABT9B6R6_9BACT|nr:NAD(P)-dependent alcohol dehydrogenase [Hymenobacter sp. ASUV-10]MDO7873490.1 NAD(P)-dependent alcohol dehydrogenase [Hymenobacter sp. ASUV-10]
MQAIYFTEYGSADVLHFGPQPTPVPSAGQLLVKVHASSVNPIDWKLRQGDMKLISGCCFPRIPGRDLAGTVAQVGPGVSQFKVGDQVFGMADGSLGGANAEYALLAAKAAALIPANLSFEQAAAVPLAALTALQALRDKGALTEGDRVLVVGAAGGVGTLAVQLARLLGAGYVAGTASPANLPLLDRLGVDDAINYKERDFTQVPNQYDVIFDAVAGSTYLAAKDALRPGGRYVTTVPDPKDVLLGGLTSAFSDKKLKMLMAKDDGADLHLVGQWLAAGKLHPVIDRTFPLAETAAAHRYSEQGHAVGKIVLTVT